MIRFIYFFNVDMINKYEVFSFNLQWSNQIMSGMFLLQFAIVLLCILVGARAGGIGLGVFGGLGLAILSFGFTD